MRRRTNFTLTTDELASVDTAMHPAPQREVRQWATAMRMLHSGRELEAVAELLAVAPSTVRNQRRPIMQRDWPVSPTSPRSDDRPKRMPPMCKPLKRR
jgi:hypothetical protein